MHTVKLVLLIIAAVCFAASTYLLPDKVTRLIPLGLLAWVLVPLIELAND